MPVDFIREFDCPRGCGGRLTVGYERDAPNQAGFGDTFPVRAGCTSGCQGWEWHELPLPEEDRPNARGEPHF